MTRKIKRRSFSFLCMHARCVQRVYSTILWKPLKYVPRTVSSYRDIKHILRSLFQRFVKQSPDTFNLFFVFFFNLMMMILFLPNIIFRQQILCDLWHVHVYIVRGKNKNRWHIIKLRNIRILFTFLLSTNINQFNYMHIFSLCKNLA